ncbi:hypothetical protein EIP91_002241 [Steccherinum ochraceum]|uniref:F-box domain-containing protein n=1 Tax=Steccherinum ochraceum TaxID=92696 RepID=A0A4V2MWC7_9APHY|nr:hypothetical protein EIP91_002241 [Steccherinum ochraceum]
MVHHVLPVVPRARSLKIALPEDAHLIKILTDHLPSSAPLLTSVHIEGPLHQYRRSEYPPILQTVVQKCAMPSLTSLQVANCRVPLLQRELFFPSLTVLGLHNTVEPRAVNVSELLDVLRGLPSLEHMTLENAIPELSYTITSLPDMYPTAALPRLKTIAVSGQALASVHFLGLCTFPVSTKISLELQSFYYGSYPNMIALLLPPLSALLETGGQVGRAMEIKMGISDFYHEVPALDPSPRLKLEPRLSIAYPVGSWLEDGFIVENLWARLPLGHVLTFICNDVRLTEQARSGWVQLFQTMANVEDFRVLERWGERAPLFVDLLFVQPNLDPVLPLLQRVLLHDFHPLYGLGSQTVESYRRIFRSRRDAGLSREQLTLKGSSYQMKEFDIPSLEQYVDVVVGEYVQW